MTDVSTVVGWTRPEMARRVAREMHYGEYVNLGIGLPTLIPAYLDPALRITLHSENGILGTGPYPTDDEVDANLINAGKETVTVLKGASFFDSALSFGMIPAATSTSRCSAVCKCRVTAISPTGWCPAVVKGIGGAMDLVHGAARVIVLMEHVDKDGHPKIVDRCTLR